MSDYTYWSVTLQFYNGDTEDITGSNHPVKGESVQVGKNRGVVSGVKHDYDKAEKTHRIFVYADIVNI
jgi:hypothetical protein